MKTSENGITLIKNFEGYASSVYKDSAGYYTIGYGHVIKPDEVLLKITEEDATKILMQDIDYIEKNITRLITVSLNQNQFDALVSLVYNIGVSAFTHSTLLKYINKNNMHLAAIQFNRWVYAGGQKLRGLERRREAEKALFLSAGI